MAPLKMTSGPPLPPGFKGKLPEEIKPGTPEEMMHQVGLSWRKKMLRDNEADMRFADEALKRGDKNPAPPETDEQRFQRETQGSLLAYTQSVFPQYKADPFHADLARELTQAVIPDPETGLPAYDRLMIFAPPQHGKSTLVSHTLPGFWMAHNPKLPVALTSYAASLAYRNSRMSRAFVESDPHIAIFPGIEVDRTNRRVDEWHIGGWPAYVRAVGVGGAITGHGFGLTIIDDPVENWAAGQSDTLRESIWQWYQGTLLTRLWEHGVIILIMTRWHEDDLAGRILREEGTLDQGGQWKVLRYSALAEEGDSLGRGVDEPLAPSRFSKDHLLRLRGNVGPAVWSAEYQQRPSRPEGELFKIGRIQIVDTVPAEVASIYNPPVGLDGIPPFPVIRTVHGGVRAWDLAGTEKKTQKADPDFTASTLIRIFNDITFVLDSTSDRLNASDVPGLVKTTAASDGRKVRIGVEKEGGQAGIFQMDQYVKMLKGYTVVECIPTGDKQVRAGPFATQVNAGNVHILRAAWNKRYLAVLQGFPKAAHDDEVDSSAHAYNAEAGGAGWVDIPFRSLSP